MTLISFGAQAVTFIALLLQASRVMETSCARYREEANLLEAGVMSAMLHTSLLVGAFLIYRDTVRKSGENQKEYHQTLENLFDDEGLQSSSPAIEMSGLGS